MLCNNCGKNKIEIAKVCLTCNASILKQLEELEIKKQNIIDEMSELKYLIRSRYIYKDNVRKNITQDEFDEKHEKIKARKRKYYYDNKEIIMQRRKESKLRNDEMMK